MTWVKVRVDDRSDGDDVEGEKEEATTLKVNERERERESVSHRVDRSMDGWMDHWCLIIIIISSRGGSVIHSFNVMLVSLTSISIP